MFKITSGYFWNYVDTYEDGANIEKDDRGIFQYISYKNVYQKTIQVLYNKKRLSIEVFHSITDGYGAVQMFNTLISEYSQLLKEVPYDDGLKIKGYDIYEDSFIKYANLDVHSQKKPCKYKKINTTAFIFNSNTFKSIAKSHGCHITEFLAVLFFIALVDVKKGQHSKQNLILRIPVNLRSIFPSLTLRNFTLCIDLVIKNKEQNIENLIKSVKEQKQYKRNADNLLKRIKRNVAFEQNPFIKYTPLSLKNLLLRSAYKIKGGTE